MFGYHIGVDIGGTFTDAVAIDEGGRLYRAKAPTTPGDYTAGILTTTQFTILHDMIDDTLKLRYPFGRVDLVSL